MRILIVESDAELRETLAGALRAEGHDVVGVTDGLGALDALQRQPADIVLCEVGAHRLDALTFLSLCRERDSHAVVIITGPRGDEEATLESMRRGAYDYIPKPYRSDHVVLVVRKAIEQERLRKEVERLRDELKSARTLDPRAAQIGIVHGTNDTGRDAGATTGDEDLSVKRRTAALERTLIRRALERTGGNRTRAARLLDLSHRALLYKIREYGLLS
jgi:DNA-binding NtrC family response regulator